MARTTVAPEPVSGPYSSNQKPQTTEPFAHFRQYGLCWLCVSMSDGPSKALLLGFSILSDHAGRTGTVRQASAAASAAGLTVERVEEQSPEGMKMSGSGMPAS